MADNPNKSRGQGGNPLGMRLTGIQEHDDDNGVEDGSFEANIDDKSVNEDAMDDTEEEVAPLPYNEDDCSEIDDTKGSWDSAAAREAAIRDGFLGFLIGYVQGHLFQKLMGWASMCWTWLLKVICRVEKDDDGGVNAEDLAQEAIEAADPGAMNTMGGGLGGQTSTANVSSMGFVGPVPPVPPPGAPFIPFVPPPGVVEMAAAASQTAASASAAGASAAVGAGGAAGAAAGSATAGMAVAMASAGVAGQVGTAVGVATAVAVTVTAVSAVVSTPTKPVVLPVSYNDIFVVPNCSGDPLVKEGYVELLIQGLAPSVFPGQGQVLEKLFR
jgi:hypothetical protein